MKDWWKCNGRRKFSYLNKEYLYNDVPGGAKRSHFKNRLPFLSFFASVCFCVPVKNAGYDLSVCRSVCMCHEVQRASRQPLGKTEVRNLISLIIKEL